MVPGFCFCLDVDCLNHLGSSSYLCATGSCIYLEAGPFLSNLFKTPRLRMLTFHFYVLSTWHITEEDTGWELVAWGFLLTRESLNSQWQFFLFLFYFPKGSTNIWLMWKLVCTFIFVIFANLLQGFMEPPWTVISIVVHSKCCGMPPYFWPEVTADPHLFLPFILAFASFYIMLVLQAYTLFQDFCSSPSYLVKIGGIGTSSSQHFGD